jgi:hypothetical protein
MKHSEAYMSILEWEAITDERMKHDVSFRDMMLDEVFDWEREDAERIILDAYLDGYINFANLIPELHYHDGLKILKKALDCAKNFSSRAADIAAILYDTTLEGKYLDRIVECYRSDPDSSYVAILKFRKPSEKLFDILADFYINNEEQIIRSTAARGLLHIKGYILDLYDNDEKLKKIGYTRKMRVDDKTRRIEYVEMLRNGIPLEVE